MIKFLDLSPGNTVFVEVNEEIKILKITDPESTRGIKGYIQPGAPEEYYKEIDLFPRPLDNDSLEELGFRWSNSAKRYVSLPGYTLKPLGKGVFHFYYKTTTGEEFVSPTVNSVHGLQNLIESRFGKQSYPLK